MTGKPVLRTIGEISGRVAHRITPDPFAFAIVLSVVVGLAGIVLTDNGPIDMAGYWYSGFWDSALLVHPTARHHCPARTRLAWIHCGGDGRRVRNLRRRNRRAATPDGDSLKEFLTQLTPQHLRPLGPPESPALLRRSPEPRGHQTPPPANLHGRRAS